MRVRVVLGVSNRKLIRCATGLWFIQKLYKSVSLSQMSMTDDPGDARQSMLYKLSKQPGLEFFNNVVLVSSPQDQYVPHNSARLELTSASDKWGEGRTVQIAHRCPSLLPQARSATRWRAIF